MTFSRYTLACGALSAVVSLTGPAAAQALDWEVYGDQDHGCHLEYPTALFNPDSEQPGEPQRFSGNDESVYFRVMGAENTSEWTPQDIKNKYLRANMPGDVTYERTKDEFLVLSGYRDGGIFYTKVAVSDDQRTACILDIAYPRSLKQQFDGIVTRMSRSFKVMD
jgi:hypothetical protein